jgi:nicotinamide riboside kinase
MIERISVFGGPGSGKTTLAARIFAELKTRRRKVEHIPEYVKRMAYANEQPRSFDQLYIIAKQLHREDQILRYVPTIVTDCPIMMCACYAKLYDFRCWQELLSIAKQWELAHPAFNLLIDRFVPYNTNGRFQSEEEAHVVDQLIYDVIMENLPQLTIVRLDGQKSSRVGKGAPEEISTVEHLIEHICSLAIG